MRLMIRDSWKHSRDIFTLFVDEMIHPRICWETWSVMFPEDIRCFRSFNIRCPRSGYPAGVDETPACVSAAFDHWTPLLTQCHVEALWLWTAARGFKEDLLPWTTTSALLQLNWPVFSLIYQALEDQSAAKDWSLRARKVVDKGSSAALISMFIARPKRITEITLWRCPCQFDSGIWCQRPSGDCQAKAAVIVLDLNDLPRGMILVQRNLNQLVAYWLLCIVKFYPDHNQIAFLLSCSSDQMCNDIGVLQEAWHTWNSPLLLCWFDIGILEEKLYYSSRQNAEEYLWTNQCS